MPRRFKCTEVARDDNLTFIGKKGGIKLGKIKSENFEEEHNVKIPSL